MAAGQSHLALGILVIIVSIVALFYVFYSLQSLADRCKTEDMPICKQLSGFTMSMLIVLLMVGGFAITISATAFIMLSAH
jgi:hypothetical protein